MPVFKAYTNLVEVNGETVLSIVNGMGIMKSVGIKFLSDSGLENVESGNWYS